MSENSIKSIFAKRLKELQEQQGNITQNHFAEKIGVSPNTLSLYYKGAKNPTLTTLVKIAEAYDVSIDWLCGLAEKTSYKSIKTYSDIFQMFVDIDDFMSDKLASCEIEINEDLENDFLIEVSAFEIRYDKKFVNLFKEWQKIRDLYINKTIDRELYDAWIEKKKREYDVDVEELPF